MLITIFVSAVVRNEPSARKPSKSGLARPGMARPGGGGAGAAAPSAAAANGGGEPPSAQDPRLRYQNMRGSPPDRRPGGGGAARPVSGVFSLDLEKIEGEKERLSEGPKLIEHNLEACNTSNLITLI